jgi:phage terminase small subunit
MKKLHYKRYWRKETRQFFQHITGQCEIDWKHFAMFYGTCENLDRFYVADEEIKRNGITFTTSGGQIRRNPACLIAKDSWAAFITGMKALGLYEFHKTGRPPGK